MNKGITEFRVTMRDGMRGFRVFMKVPCVWNSYLEAHEESSSHTIRNRSLLLSVVTQCLSYEGSCACI